MSSGADRISARQLSALALTAAEFPVFRFCCRMNWLWVLTGGAAAAATLSLLTLLINRRKAFPMRGRRRRAFSPSPMADEKASDQRTGLRAAPVRLLLAVLLSAGALLAAWESSFSFPESAADPVAVILVLGLSVAAAAAGTAVAGRCAGILLRVTGALFVAVLVFSLPQVRMEWLRPAGEPREAVRVYGLLLIPGAALLAAPALREGEQLSCASWWCAAALGTAASAVTGGILSPALQPEPEAFRTLARGVSVLGVIRRFEALVNAAMLMSAFALCVLLLTAARAALFAMGRSAPRDSENGRKGLKKFLKNRKKSVDK